MCLSVDLDETNRILNCHARIQEFSPEGGGGGLSRSLTTTFF